MSSTSGFPRLFIFARRCYCCLGTSAAPAAVIRSSFFTKASLAFISLILSIDNVKAAAATTVAVAAVQNPPSA